MDKYESTKLLRDSCREQGACYACEGEWMHFWIYKSKDCHKFMIWHARSVRYLMKKDYNIIKE